MRGIAYSLATVVALTGVVVDMAHASEHVAAEAAPIFDVTIPPA